MAFDVDEAKRFDTASAAVAMMPLPLPDFRGAACFLVAAGVFLLEAALVPDAVFAREAVVFLVVVFLAVDFFAVGDLAVREAVELLRFAVFDATDLGELLDLFAPPFDCFAPPDAVRLPAAPLLVPVEVLDPPRFDAVLDDAVVRFEVAFLAVPADFEAPVRLALELFEFALFFDPPVFDVADLLPP